MNKHFSFFQHLVLVIKIILAYVIPDSPNNLRIQLQRERQTLGEAQFEQGHVRLTLYLDVQQTNNLNMNSENLRQRRTSTASRSQGRSNSISPISQYLE